MFSKLHFQKLHTNNDNTLRTNNTYRSNNICKKNLKKIFKQSGTEHFAIETP